VKASLKEVAQSLLEAAEAEEKATAEPKPVHAPAETGMLEEAPGQKSVRRVVFFWSFVLGWLLAGVLIWRGHPSEAKELAFGLMGFATGGVAIGRWAEAYENKGKDE